MATDAMMISKSSLLLHVANVLLPAEYYAPPTPVRRPLSPPRRYASTVRYYDGEYAYGSRNRDESHYLYDSRPRSPYEPRYRPRYEDRYEHHYGSHHGPCRQSRHEPHVESGYDRQPENRPELTVNFRYEAATYAPPRHERFRYEDELLYDSRHRPHFYYEGRGGYHVDGGRDGRNSIIMPEEHYHGAAPDRDSLTLVPGDILPTVPRAAQISRDHPVFAGPLPAQQTGAAVDSADPVHTMARTDRGFHPAVAAPPLAVDSACPEYVMTRGKHEDRDAQLERLCSETYSPKDRRVIPERSKIDWSDDTVPAEDLGLEGGPHPGLCAMTFGQGGVCLKKFGRTSNCTSRHD